MWLELETAYTVYLFFIHDKERGEDFEMCGYFILNLLCAVYCNNYFMFIRMTGLTINIAINSPR